MTEKIRIALRKAAEALCHTDAASVDRAEAAIIEALQGMRRLVAEGRFPTTDWPPHELVLCRRMVETSSQYWERRRSARAVAADTPPTSWMA